MDLRHYVGLLRRNWLLLAVAIALSVTVTVVQDSRQPEVYQAQAQLLLLPENVVDPNNVGGANRIDPYRYSTAQLAVLTSRDLATRAAPTMDGVTVEEILANVTAAVEESFTVVTVAATSRDPERAAMLVNGLVGTYLDSLTEASTGRLTDAITEIEARLAELAVVLAGFDVERVTADQLAAQQQYQALFARQQELQVQLSLQRSTARVLEPAQVPAVPIGLGVTSKAVIGGFLGVVLGLGAVYAREQLDDRVRSRDEVQALTGYPVLAELPVERQRSRAGAQIAAVDRALDPLAEAVRSLRTSIGFLSLDRGIEQLAITSAMPGEGKSLVAANLGAACATAGRRTVLVSADLRRPGLEGILGMEGSSGLSDAFTEMAQRADGRAGASSHGVPGLHDAGRSSTAVLGHVVETRIGGLYLLPAGTPVPNPSELLSSSHMDEVLHALGREFDMVIVDTSPILTVADAAAVSTKVGNVLLVASMPRTRRRTLTRSVEAVEASRARLLGIALNRVPMRTVHYGGYYRPPADREEVPAGGSEQARRRLVSGELLRTPRVSDSR